MARPFVLGLVLLALHLGGCGSDRGSSDAGPSTDTGPATDTGASTDAGAVAVDGASGGGVVTGAAADIQRALSCGAPAGVTGTARADELQLHELSNQTFPDALCNDGSAPTLYYRPFRGEANRNRWVISLRGGGSCSSASSCAARWCACDNTTRCPFVGTTTRFTLNNMSGGGGRSQPGGGVMARDAMRPNPLADYNHAQFVYCSSDGWSGSARGVTFTTTHPRTGAAVTYSMHFLGARILDADLRVLRQDGVSPLAYTIGGGSVAMPDLDESTEVVIVGDSAGGAGVVQNLDHIAETLRAQRGGCDGGASCAPSVFGIIDAATGPELRRLDFTRSAGAASGIDTYDEFVAMSARSAPNTGARRDASCLRWHQMNRPGTEAECGEDSHVIRHHVTTPFFVRMALLDGLIAGNYEDSGLADPMLGPFTRNAMGVPLTFATVLQRELTAFPQLPGTAEEGAPSCSNHDTIHDDREVYGVTITPSGGRALRFFDVFSAWRAGTSPAAVLSSDPARRDTVCPPSN